MLVSRLVHIDVNQQGPAVGVVQIETGLLDGFASSTHFRRFARFQVTSRLHPAVESAMSVQEYTTPTDHDGRGGDMGEISVPVERLG